MYDHYQRIQSIDSSLHNGPNNFVNYENENFWETQNDKLFETKNIMGYLHFWERVDAFFKTRVTRDIGRELKQMYPYNTEIVKLMQHEIGQHLHDDFIDDPIKRDQIKLSKRLKDILL